MSVSFCRRGRLRGTVLRYNDWNDHLFEIVKIERSCRRKRHVPLSCHLQSYPVYESVKDYFLLGHLKKFKKK